jgi:two-component system nitrate/nitrite response regulator NarL
VIRVMFVSELRLNREGIAALIDDHDGIEVRPRATIERELLDDDADVIVIDASARNGFGAARSAIDLSGAPVVVLGAPEDEAEVIKLAELGVIGFVDRDGDVGELVTGIERAAREEASFSPRVGTALLRRINSAGPRRPAGEMAVLTMREREVVHLVAEGMTNKEIAQRLCIEVATVKNHVHNILGKLEVEGRSEAVARLQIVAPPPRHSQIQISG